MRARPVGPDLSVILTVLADTAAPIMAGPPRGDGRQMDVGNCAGRGHTISENCSLCLNTTTQDVNKEWVMGD